jgi:hypothetical protein
MADTDTAAAAAAAAVVGLVGSVAPEEVGVDSDEKVEKWNLHLYLQWLRRVCADFDTVVVVRLGVRTAVDFDQVTKWYSVLVLVLLGLLGEAKRHKMDADPVGAG